MSRVIEITEYQCNRCGKKAEAEAGSKMLCQSCVNEFLAANVGMMVEVPEEAGPPQVEPLPPMPQPPHETFPRLEEDA